jgi:hypothetical protein
MKKLHIDKAILTDSNHHDRRFFRCWIDGSYNGENHYRANCEYIRENYHNEKRLRALAISEWCARMAADNDCSVSTVQRAMVREFTGGELDQLNLELVDDLRDLVRDDMEDS